MWPFSDFQYGFRSYGSTANLLTVVSDRIARSFSRSAATQALALDLSEAFVRVLWLLVFFTNFSLMEYLVRYMALFLPFSVIGSFG